MPITAISAKLSGNPDRTGWSQTHQFFPEASKSLLGELYILIVYKNGDEARNSLSLGKNVAQQTSTIYYTQSTELSLNSLKSAVVAGCRDFLKDEAVDVAAVVTKGDLFYCVLQGEIKILLARDNTITTLVAGKNYSTLSLSGRVIDNDHVIVATNSFLTAVPPDKVITSLVEGSLQTALEAFTPLIHISPNTGLASAVFFKFINQHPVNNTYLKDFNIEKSEIERWRANSGSANSGLKEKLKSLSESLRGFTTFRQTKEDLSLINKRRKLSAFVGILILFTLIASTGWGVRQKKIKDQNAYLTGQIEQSEHLLDEALKMLALDKTRARELLADSKSVYNNIDPSLTDRDEVIALRYRISESEGQVLGEHKSSTDLFLDLSLLSEGFTGDSMNTSADNLFVLDSSAHKLARISISNKKSTILAGPQQIPDAIFAFGYADRVFVADKKGVSELKPAPEPVVEGNWGTGKISAAAYAGNIYIINSENQTIEKFTGEAGGFGTKVSWLGDVKEEALKETESIAIDGTIWVLTSSGDILKFNQGVRQRFSVYGMTTNFRKPKQIFTGEKVKYLYILDPENIRIVVLEKTGKYVVEYTSDEIKDASGFSVDEDGKKIILLFKGKLLSIAAKHLD